MTDYEHEPIDPLCVANDSAGEAWLRGYSDAHSGRDVNPPEQNVAEYLRGYIAGPRGT
jgi:hypothetical protein